MKQQLRRFLTVRQIVELGVEGEVVMLPPWINVRDHGDAYVPVPSKHKAPLTGDFMRLKQLPVDAVVLLDEEDGDALGLRRAC